VATEKAPAAPSSTRSARHNEAMQPRRVRSYSLPAQTFPPKHSRPNIPARNLQGTGVMCMVMPLPQRVEQHAHRPFAPSQFPVPPWKL